MFLQNQAPLIAFSLLYIIISWYDNNPKQLEYSYWPVNKKVIPNKYKLWPIANIELPLRHRTRLWNQDMRCFLWVGISPISYNRYLLYRANVTMGPAYTERVNITRKTLD